MTTLRKIASEVRATIAALTEVPAHASAAEVAATMRTLESTLAAARR